MENMYVIKVHSAEEIDDAMVLFSVVAHVKLEVTSPHTIVLRLEGDNRLRKKTIEEKLGSLRSSGENVQQHNYDKDYIPSTSGPPASNDYINSCCKMCLEAKFLPGSAAHVYK
ncbi:unnamed protein product [Darwinula stevensoni]|uniref:Uncharacterized protein n=1 Tax=Darwinula stevensoni TaxID=69355 RepID=A0A7R8XB39_9CRUS|nr:unnamed protein product [Darwinula stevensoni]CAG0892481.1 unnamed protein product [Darwinula stevensoni]